MDHMPETFETEDLYQESETFEAEELNQKGIEMQSMGNPEEALDLFRQALESDPLYIDSYINIGNAYTAANEFDKAFEIYERGLLLDKHCAQIYFHMGNMCYLQKKYEQAIRNYNMAIAEGMEDAAVFFHTGLVYEEKKDTLHALENYTAAIRTEPDSPTYRLKKAILQINAHQLEDALLTLDEMMRDLPEVFEGYHYYFEALCLLGRYDEAKSFLEQTAAEFPSEVSVFYDRVHMEIKTGNDAEAIRMIEEVQSQEQYHGELRNLIFEKAKILAHQKRLEEAIAEFEKCKALEEDGVRDFEVRYYLVNMYFLTDRYDKVLENAEEMIQTEEHNAFVRAGFYFKAYALKRLGKEEQAAKQFDEAIAVYRMMSIQNPSQFDVYLLRALCMIEMGEYGRAEEQAAFVAKLDKQAAEPYYIRGAVYCARGEEKKALQAFETAKKMNPDIDWVF